VTQTLARMNLDVSTGMDGWMEYVCTYACLCMYVCMHGYFVCMHESWISVCMYIYIYIIYIYIYIYMYTHTHTHTHTHEFDISTGIDSQKSVYRVNIQVKHTTVYATDF